MSAAALSPRSFTEDSGIVRVGSGTASARIWLKFADEHKRIELRKLAGVFRSLTDSRDSGPGWQCSRAVK